MIYSDEAGMASGNGNSDSFKPIIASSIVEEVSDVLIPQLPAELVPPLFDDQGIFINVA